VGFTPVEVRVLSAALLRPGKRRVVFVLSRQPSTKGQTLTRGLAVLDGQLPPIFDQGVVPSLTGRATKEVEEAILSEPLWYRTGGDQRVTAPRPVLGPPAQDRRDWIHRDVRNERLEIPIVGHMLGSIAVLEQVADTKMSAIELPRVLAMEQLDTLTQIWVRGFDKQVNVVRHQAIAQAQPILTLDHGGQELQVPPVVVVIDKDADAIDASREDVGDRTFVFLS
jgi:hypothetical protein